MGEYPLVSCIMVTRGHKRPAMWALDSFFRQTYPNKKLYIITTNADGDLKEYVQKYLMALYKQGVSSARNVSYIRLTNPNISVGMQRNAVLKQIKEGYVAIWDDDDVSGPTRLQNAMQALIGSNADAYYLERMFVWSEKLRSVFITEQARWPNTMVAKRSVLCEWPDKTVGEDIQQYTHLTQNCKCVSGNFPEDFLYIHTGFNTSGDGNFQFLRRNASETLKYAEGIVLLKEKFNIEQYQAWLEKITHKMFSKGK